MRALERALLEVVAHVTVHSLQLDVVLAVAPLRAVIVRFEPFAYASVAVDCVALDAFFRLNSDHVADGAHEEVSLLSLLRVTYNLADVKMSLFLVALHLERSQLVTKSVGKLLLQLLLSLQVRMDLFDFCANFVGRFHCQSI